ncbi:CD36 protein, partial [Psilopogon haemacephalus]|nr:CD36 protein [Psilopogon haemacephalus]
AVIANGTIAFQNWLVPGSSVYRQFWIFDVQNPSEVMEKGARPRLEQRGPYTYRPDIFSLCSNLSRHLSFEKLFLFPTLKVLHVTILTLLSSQALDQAAPSLYTNNFIQLLLNTWIKSSKSSMLQNRTVKELLWGYKDPFLSKVPFPVNSFLGVFYPYNGTSDGLYRVYTGTEDITQTAIIESYKNKRY